MEVSIFIQSVELKASIDLPEEAVGLVIILRRNEQIALGLQKLGVATLQTDLLSPEEDTKFENKVVVDLMTERLIAVTKWCLENDKIKKLNLGYVGFGSGAAASLSAAAYWGPKIKAVIFEGKRPDLALEVLDLIESPTMIIVGDEDKAAVDINRQAYQKIGAVKKLEMVRGDIGRELDLIGTWLSKYL